jgi:hypothetical protein
MKRPDETPGPFWIRWRPELTEREIEDGCRPWYGEHSWGWKWERVTYATLGDARAVAREGSGVRFRAIYRPKTKAGA